MVMIQFGFRVFTGVNTPPINQITTNRGWAAAWADFDNDGDLDLYADGPASGRALYRNDTENGNHWLELRLEGVRSNRSAIGAKVRALARIGGQDVRQLREVSAQNTFNGHNSLIVHFGLRDAVVVDQLTIEWPSGIVQTLHDVSADQRLVIIEETTTPSVPDGHQIPGTPCARRAAATTCS